MKRSLQAIAKAANIDLQVAVRTVRRHPLFDEEIHIEEELINLEEAIRAYHSAADSLERYPKIKRHLLSERRAILKHCIGLIARMLHGRKLPHEYTQEDIGFAMRKLVQLLVDDAKQAGWKINGEVLRTMKPYMSPRQRIEYSERSLNPWNYVRPAMRRLAIVRS